MDKCVCVCARVCKICSSARESARQRAFLKPCMQNQVILSTCSVTNAPLLLVCFHAFQSLFSSLTSVVTEGTYVLAPCCAQSVRTHNTARARVLLSDSKERSAARTAQKRHSSPAAASRKHYSGPLALCIHPFITSS